MRQSIWGLGSASPLPGSSANLPDPSPPRLRQMPAGLLGDEQSPSKGRGLRLPQGVERTKGTGPASFLQSRFGRL